MLNVPLDGFLIISMVRYHIVASEHQRLPCVLIFGYIAHGLPGDYHRPKLTMMIYDSVIYGVPVRRTGQTQQWHEL